MKKITWEALDADPCIDMSIRLEEIRLAYLWKLPSGDMSFRHEEILIMTLNVVKSAALF